MTREEAIRIMQLNKGRMNGSVQAALAVLLPELDAPQRTVLEWRTCKAGDRFTFKALIRYPAYAEIGYYAKADGDWVPMDEIEHPQEKKEGQKPAEGIEYSCPDRGTTAGVWSEEDERTRQNLMSLLANMRGDRIKEETYNKYYPWLQSLRNGIFQNGNTHWKPSEEQMDALRVTLEYMPDTFKPRCTLMTILDDLKKL